MSDFEKFLAIINFVLFFVFLKRDWPRGCIPTQYSDFPIFPKSQHVIGL